MNERDNRLRTAPHRTHDARIKLLHRHLSLGSSGAGRGKGVSAKVGPGAEKPALATKDDDPDVQLRFEGVEVLGQFARHLGRNRVERLGPIQRKNLDRAPPLKLQRCIAHAPRPPVSLRSADGPELPRSSSGPIAVSSGFGRRRRDTRTLYCFPRKATPAKPSM